MRYIKLEIFTVKVLKNLLDMTNLSTLYKLTVSIPARDDTHHPEMLLKKYARCCFLLIE